MPPGNSMGQMIQMLSVLSDIKDRRAQMQQAKDQFEEQKRQWAQQFGLNEKVHNIGNFTKGMEAVANGTAKPEDYETIGTALGYTPEQKQALKLMGPSADTYLQQLQANAQKYAQRQIEAGGQSMTPQQLQHVQQNAYSRAMTGQSTADLSQGALIGTMAGNMNPQAVYGMDMLTKLGQGLATRMATGQTIDQFGTSQYAVNTPGYIPSAARIAAGMAPSAGQSMSDRLGYYNADINKTQGAQAIALQAYNAQRSGQGGADGAPTIDDLRQVGIELQKSKSVAAMRMFGGQYNSIAVQLGLPTFKGIEDLPNALGILDNLIGKRPKSEALPFYSSPGNPPPAGNPPLGRGPGGGNPYQPPAPPPLYQPPRY